MVWTKSGKQFYLRYVFVQFPKRTALIYYFYEHYYIVSFSATSTKEIPKLLAIKRVNFSCQFNHLVVYVKDVHIIVLKSCSNAFWGL